MRTRSEGTQASGAGESHAQYANVAEVSYGKAVIGESENPESIEPPGGSRERIGSNDPLTRRHKSDKQVTNGVVGSTGKIKRALSSPQSRIIQRVLDGASKTIHP